MKKYFLAFLLLLVTFLAYRYNAFSVLLGLLFVFCLMFLVIVILVRFSRKIHPKWYQVPLMLMGILLAGVLVSFFKTLPPAVTTSGDESQQLEYAYKTDQSDRMNLKVYLGTFNEELRKRDSTRLVQVMRLYTENKIEQPLDKFHAAFVFHHASGSDNYEKAHKLATEAASELEEHYLSQWLAKASYDRWMLSLGKPEKYGTQNRIKIERQ